MAEEVLGLKISAELIPKNFRIVIFFRCVIIISKEGTENKESLNGRLETVVLFKGSKKRSRDTIVGSEPSRSALFSCLGSALRTRRTTLHDRAVPFIVDVDSWEIWKAEKKPVISVVWVTAELLYFNFKGVDSMLKKLSFSRRA